MTEIKSNGSKWAGQDVDTIDVLLNVLATHPLDPTFERHGWLMTTDDDSGYFDFFGNFYDLSHVFSIRTDNQRTAEALWLAIQTNIESDAYKAARIEAR